MAAGTPPRLIRQSRSEVRGRSRGLPSLQALYVKSVRSESQNLLGRNAAKVLAVIFRANKNKRIGWLTNHTVGIRMLHFRMTSKTVASVILAYYGHSESSPGDRALGPGRQASEFPQTDGT